VSADHALAGSRAQVRDVDLFELGPVRGVEHDELAGLEPPRPHPWTKHITEHVFKIIWMLLSKEKAARTERELSIVHGFPLDLSVCPWKSRGRCHDFKAEVKSFIDPAERRPYAGLSRRVWRVSGGT
jgi:hypothetical protein